MNDKRGISAVELSKSIDVMYKTVWYTWTFHGLSKKNPSLYLSEFCFKFNRRSMSMFKHLAITIGCLFLPKQRG